METHFAFASWLGMWRPSHAMSCCLLCAVVSLLVGWLMSTVVRF